jgi:hypothetical protein
VAVCVLAVCETVAETWSRVIVISSGPYEGSSRCLVEDELRGKEWQWGDPQVAAVPVPGRPQRLSAPCTQCLLHKHFT